MDQRLYKIFDELANEYVRFRSFPRLSTGDHYNESELNRRQRSILTISNAIDAAQHENQKHMPSLRPDGKYFLLTNFYEMISLPLLDSKSGLDVDIDELENAINMDIRAIVEVSIDLARGKEITSGDLLRSIAEIWDKLRVNELRFWGARDPDERR